MTRGRHPAWALGGLLLAAAASAGPESMPASLSTTADLKAFQVEVEARRNELAERVVSIQAALAETRTASIPGFPEALGRQITALDQIRLELAQQVTELQQSANLLPTRQQVETQLAALRRTGMPEPPPYPLPMLDQLVADRAAEVERGVAIEQRRAAAAQVRQDAALQVELGRAGRAAAEAALAANADPTRIPTLGAEVEAATMELRRREELWRLRDLEVRNEELDLELQRLRLTLLDERIGWVRKASVLRQEDLRGVELRLEKEGFDLQRSLDALRLELTAVERRWTAARQKLDGLGEPDEVLAEEVQTRFQEVQARQREIALIEKRLARLARATDVWGARYRIASGDFTAEEATTLATESRRVVDELSREDHLQTTRIADLEREAVALSNQAGPLSVGSRLQRTLKDRQAALERMVRAGRENQASIRMLRTLRQRLLDELPAEAVTPGSAGRLTQLAAFLRARRDDILPFLWPLVRVLLVVFLGFPLNLFLSRRVQAVSARLYNAQSGMIAGKVIYYGGVTILVFLFLNSIGVGMAPLLGAAGVTGVALGFASQTSVSNMISGLFLIAEQPFQVDDVIVVGDVTGKVLSIDLLSVKLRQFDNKFTRIPNETILRSNVTNISRHPIRRVDTSVSIAYKEDMAAVEGILKQVAADDPDVLQYPEATVIFQRFGDSGIDYKLCVWGARDNFLTLLNRIPRTIKSRFDAAGIEIPFPHLSLYRGAASPPLEVRVLHQQEAEQAPEAAPAATREDAGQ